MPETTEQTVLPPVPDPRALNAMRHGILSELVPSWERDAYAAHAQAVRESVGAVNYLQERLADRAALALWRLDRVARWEAGEMQAEQRRFLDRLHSREAGLGAAFAGLLPSVPLDRRGLRESLEALAELTGEAAHAFLSDPQTAESYARDLDREAAGWAVLVARGEPSALPAELAGSLGLDLVSALLDRWDVNPARVARMLVGRKPTRDEVEAVTDGDWTVEPHELPALVGEAARVAGEGWGRWLLEMQHTASLKAGQVRAVAARLPVLLEQELAQATEPNTSRLEKLARYEAHLERVLYRALGELEATRDSSATSRPTSDRHTVH